MKVAVGIGCDRGTSLATLEAALSQALAEAGLSSEAIVLLASITLKADEPGLLALAARLPWLGVPLVGALVLAAGLALFARSAS